MAQAQVHDIRSVLPQAGYEFDRLPPLLPETRKYSGTPRRAARRLGGTDELASQQRLLTRLMLLSVAAGLATIALKMFLRLRESAPPA